MHTLTTYILHLADNALILGHRNSEWTGHGPILEQDIALSNISLDLIGQARNFYQYAADLIGGGATEDALAYLREPEEFTNCLLAEQDNGDWAKTILRQFFISAYQSPLYHRLSSCNDERLSGIAAKSLKETTYHLRWSGEWVIRLGQGTAESHRRMVNAINDLWCFTEELVTPVEYETKVLSAQDIAYIRETWHSYVHELVGDAGLAVPGTTIMQFGGKNGLHKEHLNSILADMQYLQRTYPGMNW